MAILTWSPSRLVDFEKCKFYAHLKHDRRIPEPDRPLPPGKTEHANDRGSRIHNELELYVRGDGPMPPEASKFEDHFVKMRDLYEAGVVSLEGEWGMDRQWNPCGWNGEWREADKVTHLGREFTKAKKLPDRGLPGELILVAGTFYEWLPVWLRLKLDALVHLSETEAVVIDYKGLPLDTPLPTPGGWTTMGEVRVGDRLFDRNGAPCTVTGKSSVKTLPCYRLVFDDTSEAICDEEHRWTTADGEVRTVTDLCAGDLIQTAEPLQLPERPLVLDPYVLGVWLADGKHTSGEISKPDDFIWEEVARRGFELSHDYSGGTDRCRTHTVKGLRTKLGELGLLGDKQIPADYLRASYSQRLDLLRGIMDGDGSANHKRKQAVINTTRLDFAEQIKELLLSLGQRPLLSPYTAHGFGKAVQAYAVSFRPRNLNPFLLPRKANKVLPTWGAGESWRRRILRIELIPARQTQCIMVDSPDRTFLCTSSFIPTHNTGKKFGNEIKHGEQLQMYQLCTFLRYPKLEVVHTELWYLDVDDLTHKMFTRDQGLRFKRSFDQRGSAVTDCTDFKPNPNRFSCQWCRYGTKEGSTGDCKVGV